MNDITPIETTYKGYRFRSRLEARWAVFLDAIKVRWEYEMEGYVLQDGTKYLPDFFLPDIGMWIEVKAPGAGAAEFAKARQLFLGTQQPVFVTSGMPDSYGLLIFNPVLPQLWLRMPLGERAEYGENLSIKQGATYWAPDTFMFTILDERAAEQTEYWMMAHDKIRVFTNPAKRPPLASENYNALMAARGARFEHGEEGAAS
jgi:hypothetical protein